MENSRCKFLPRIVATFLISLTLVCDISQATSDEETLKTYIVLVKKPEGTVSMQSEDLDSWYKSFLPVTTSSSGQPRMKYYYRNVITGFAARLTAEEAKAMEEKEEILSALPERVLSLHTTHSPAFLGLQQKYGFWNHSNYGKGVIIGLLDTGVAPDHPSFRDEGMPPPPAKWKGKCEFTEAKCNNKLIGARHFQTSDSPMDDFGHGTHTSSTAAGSPIPGANILGQANGTAVGIAPLAHVAMYKVCGENGGCTDSDILAGMDAAVEDGVDILSLSLGGPSLPFFVDSIALGAYGAIQKGVLVSCSAGNSGPYNYSLSNEAPWILTVGASTIDRVIRATVLLGDKSEFNGESLYQPKDFPPTLLPLVYAGANGNMTTALCGPGSLKDVDVKGKIVVCEGGGFGGAVARGQEVKDNGGAGMILVNYEYFGYATEVDAHVLPASHVSYEAGLAIKTYINSTSSPMATIVFKGTVIGIPDAPQVAYFSSRGPALASPGIVKPDIIGPGVHILAAWPDSFYGDTNSTVNFAMISGTSMSCPHLAGVAALLKSAHPDWSPAAIKSAMLTTADVVNLRGKPIYDEFFNLSTAFDMGAGHVNPSKANDPGLVYDVQPDDYIPYLCGLGYSDKEVGVIVQRDITCSSIPSITGPQLNFPSFLITFGPNPLTYTRTVTNVGEMSASTYKLEILAPPGVDVQVTPAELVFSSLNQKATYTVTFSKNGIDGGVFGQGYLTWMNDKYNVKSPIAVFF